MASAEEAHQNTHTHAHKRMAHANNNKYTQNQLLCFQWKIGQMQLPISSIFDRRWRMIKI